MKATHINELIYRNYLTSALVPILAIEVVLLILYFGINLYISDKSQATLLREATQNIQEIASSEVATIDAQLKEANHLSLIMQRDHEAFFARPGHCFLRHGEPEFAVHENGAFYKRKDNGGASLYYSSATAIGEVERNKARCSETLDPLLKSIVDTSPVVTQAYLNTWDDMNRLYPFMPDAPGQYGSAINMEDYNFYYEADAAHDPERKPVWTSAYLDPAGQGWMVSLIVPIYRGDFLEGVSGLDVTIGAFVQNILNLDFPWDASVLMVDPSGTILAMQGGAEEILGLKELGQHAYAESIKATIEKPEEFNLLKSPVQDLAAQVNQLFESRARIGSLTINDTDYLVSQEIVPETGWRMLTLIEKTHLFAHVVELKALSTKVGFAAIGAMVIFYILFFVYLLQKSGKLTALIARPIAELSEKTRGLGENLKFGELDRVGIKEIDELLDNFNGMARELEIRTSALIDAKLAAESASIAKSRFLATMSHELRTPLNAVIGMAGLMEMSGDDPAKRGEYTRAIKSAGTQLNKMIGNILDFSNIETNNLVLSFTRCSPLAVAQSCVAKLRDKAEGKGLALSCNCDGAVPESIVCDERRLEQVLLNLVGNAIKFTDSGGSVRLDMAPGDDQAAVAEVHFSVTDTGIGMTAEQCERLFQPFKQLDDSDSRAYGGVGLGLLLAKKLIELMGGRIWVESEPGAGSTFHFTIPVESKP